MTLRNSHTYDNLLLLKDAAAVTASGAAQVSGQARVLDMGPARFSADMIVDTSALDFTTADETYRVNLQGSNDPAFGSGVVDLGGIVIEGAGGSGRATAAVSNEKNGTIYRYVRAYHTLAGTTPSINYTANLAQRT